jgi:hypothetical protein
MNRIMTFAILGAIAASHSAYSHEEDNDRTYLEGAVCKIDVANHTIRVLPWDRKARMWKRDSVRVLTWNDQTHLRSAAAVLTMPQFIGGKPLDKEFISVIDIRGERARFHVKTIGGKEVIQEFEMMRLLSRESAPAIPAGKVFCGMAANN